MSEEILKNLAILVQKEFGHVNEVFSMTKELADSFSRNDKTSARMILRMRGKEIAEIDKVRRKITILLNNCKPQRERLEQLLRGENVPQETELETRICKIAKMMEETVKKTVEMDQRMSNRFGE